MPLKTSHYDPVDYLKTDADIAELLADAAESGDSNYIAHANNLAERARQRLANSLPPA
jgi:DNA-binding phage protein